MAKLSDATIAQMDMRIGGRQDTCLAVYSRDFDSLWAHVTGDPAEPLPRNVFLVWDEIPKSRSVDDIGVRNYLTAYDWVIAMVLAAQKASADEKRMTRFDFTLRILPTTPPDAHPRSLATRVIPLLRSAILPWVTLDELYAQADFVQAGMASETETLGPTLAQTFREPGLQGKASSSFIKDLWRTELTKAGARHSVSNAIGPPALAQSLKDSGFSAADSVLRDWLEGEDRLRLTFWRFLELLELLPALENREGAKVQSALGGLADEPFVTEDLFGQFKRLRFALVDDQAGAGFHDALSAFLLGPELERAGLTDNSQSAPIAVSGSKDGLFSLSSFSRPDVLLGWLRQTLAQSPANKSHRPVFGRRNLYAGSAAPSEPTSEFDILFLDLRLHGISGASSEGDSETTWTSKLLGFVDGALSGLISQHPLSDGQKPAFDAAVDAARQRRLAVGRGEEVVVRQLALLPILISIVDPTTPIILFSSTRHRAVLELLRPFPNIITAFAKPAITGYGGEDHTALNSIAQSLKQALNEALVLHEKRCLCDLISEFELRQAASPPCVVESLEMLDMPCVNNRYLANAKGRKDLPLFINGWYTQRFRSIILDYIVGKDNTDHLYKPYEFFESNLSTAYTTKSSFRLVMHFKFGDFRKFMDAKEIDNWPQRSKSIEWIKSARHKVVHGKIGSKANNTEDIRYSGFIVTYKFLFGVHNHSLRRKLDLLSSSSDPLVQSVMTGRRLRETVVSGPLALSVTAFAKYLGT